MFEFIQEDVRHGIEKLESTGDTRNGWRDTLNVVLIGWANGIRMISNMFINIWSTMKRRANDKWVDGDILFNEKIRKPPTRAGSWGEQRVFLR